MKNTNAAVPGHADGAAPNMTTRCWSPPQDVPGVLFPILDAASSLDDLARLLATDRLSMSAKVRVLEHWRYDLVQLQVGAGEGLNCEHGDAVLLQQLDRTLRLLDDRASGNPQVPRVRFQSLRRLSPTNDRLADLSSDAVAPALG